MSSAPQTGTNAIVRPNREPDYISVNSSYFWFDEMLYVDGKAGGDIKQITTDQETGKLRSKDIVKCHRCDRCDENKLCERNFFASHIQEAKKNGGLRHLSLNF